MKWLITVRFRTDNKNKVDEESIRAKYEEFKKRMFRSRLKDLKMKDFSDKSMSFTHMCTEPANVLDYFYNLNPMPGDDILDNAEIVIEKRAFRGRYPWGSAKKTDGIVKEVN